MIRAVRRAKAVGLTPLLEKEVEHLFPGGAWTSHATANTGPYELSDGRWMWSVEGMLV